MWRNYASILLAHTIAENVCRNRKSTPKSRIVKNTWKKNMGGWYWVRSLIKTSKQTCPPLSLCLASLCLSLCEVLPAWDFITHFHFRTRSRLAGIRRQAGLLQLLSKPAAAPSSILLLFLIPLPAAGKLCDSSRQMADKATATIRQDHPRLRRFLAL